jgi:hypothetical protein
MDQNAQPFFGFRKSTKGVKRPFQKKQETGKGIERAGREAKKTALSETVKQ